MEFRQNEIKQELLRQRAYLMGYLPYGDRGATQFTINLIDWIIKTFCDGDYVILKKDELDFLFSAENKSSFGGSSITMDVNAGHARMNCEFKKEQIDDELKEYIKNQLIQQWLYENTL